MRIKVCGITNVQQIHQIDELGVEFCGFIFYPKSQRFIFKYLTAEDLKKIKGKINKVGVFVNAKVDEILKMVDDCGLYLVQLHGNETPYECEKISNYITTIKAFRLSDDDDILWKIRNYRDVADMFLFDTQGVGYGGTGKKFNWEKLKDLDIQKPFFLSGGIQPEDVFALHEFAQTAVAKDLFAVDINSKFEIAPGLKNINLIEKFINELK